MGELSEPRLVYAVRQTLPSLAEVGLACGTISVVTKLHVDYLNRERYTAALLAKNIDDTKYER